MSGTEWRDRARCRDAEDLDQFAVENAGAYTLCRTVEKCTRWIDRGAVCDGCPVIAECARDALEHGDGGVIRGGIPLVHESHSGGPGINRTRCRDALRLVACGASPADAREWLLTERLARARNTSGHPLQLESLT